MPNPLPQVGPSTRFRSLQTAQLRLHQEDRIYIEQESL